MLRIQIRPRASRWAVFLGVTLTLMSWPSPAAAKVPLLDPLVGAFIDGILKAAGASDLGPLKAWRPIQDPRLTARVEHAVSQIRFYGQNEWRWSEPPKVVVTEGNSDEPNAMCTGSSIYVSRPMLELLDDRQLRAVLAHEMAHAERGHLTERMSHAPSAVAIQLWRVLKSDWNAMTGGEADAFMHELWKNGHWKMIQEMLESATLGQEMQADCLAAQWLDSLHSRGLEQSPDDILSAMARLLGISREALESSPFNGPRAVEIESKTWRSGRCGV